MAQKKARLDELRPAAGESLSALAAWYDVELTYTSNAIEGNVLTRSETAIVLGKGIAVNGKPLKDHCEALDHKDALDHVRYLARRDAPIREMDVRQIHELVMRRVDRNQAGRYATRQRLISGSAYVPPGPAQLGSLMGDLGQWLSRAAATAETAIAAHERLVSIHPFDDGNGRTSRLLMNLVLLKGGYPPVVIGPEHRSAYHDGLRTLQLGGDRIGYRRFMTERLEESLDHHVVVLQRGLDQAPGQPPVLPP